MNPDRELPPYLGRASANHAVVAPRARSAEAESSESSSLNATSASRMCPRTPSAGRTEHGYEDDGPQGAISPCKSPGLGCCGKRFVGCRFRGITALLPGVWVFYRADSMIERRRGTHVCSASRGRASAGDGWLGRGARNGRMSGFNPPHGGSNGGHAIEQRHAHRRGYCSRAARL